MGVQVNHLHAIRPCLGLQRAVQLARQAKAPKGRAYKQAYHLHRFKPSVIQLRETTVIRQIADGGHDLAFSAGDQESPVTLKVGGCKLRQVGGHACGAELGKQLGTRLQ